MKNLLRDSLIFLFFLAVVLTAPLIRYIPNFISNYKGFCVNQNRYVSNDEKIRNAIEDINNEPKSIALFQKDHVETIEFPEQYIPYKSIEDFREKNQNCCLITKQAYKDLMPPIPFSSRITGAYSDNIKVDYVANYKDKNGLVISKNVTETRQIDNCGKVK